MVIEERISQVENVLNPWREVLGKDYLAYRNHVYRVAHYSLALRDCSIEEREKILTAACFHDLGIWTNKTLDYLPPSIALAVEYLKDAGRVEWIPDIELMIDMHHKIRPYRDDRYPLVEVFRRGDLADVSLGLFKSGLSRSYVRNVKAQFPNAGFHRCLARLGLSWFAKHPVSPPPFFKW